MPDCENTLSFEDAAAWYETNERAIIQAMRQRNELAVRVRGMWLMIQRTPYLTGLQIMFVTMVVRYQSQEERDESNFNRDL